jgi:hypothetical protein
MNSQFQKFTSLTARIQLLKTQFLWGGFFLKNLLFLNLQRKNILTMAKEPENHAEKMAGSVQEEGEENGQEGQAEEEEAVEGGEEEEGEIFQLAYNYSECQSSDSSPLHIIIPVKFGNTLI